MRDQTDRVFFWLLPLQWAVALGVGWYCSAAAADTLWLAAGGFAVCALVPMIIIAARRGQPLTRWVVTVAQMLFTVLLTRLLEGQPGAHFHVFISLTLLASYRDPWLFAVACPIVWQHHLQQVFMQAELSLSDLLCALEHMGWIGLNVLFLLLIIRQSREHLCHMAGLQVALTGERDLLERRVEVRTLELRQSESEARAVLDSSLDAIITTDEKGIILHFNPPAAAMFGTPAEQALGQPIGNLVFPLPMRDFHETVWQRDFLAGQSKVLNRRNRVTACRHNGCEFPAELSVIRVVTGQSVRFIACIRDITKDVQRERELEEAVRESQDDRALLNQILNNIPACVFWKDRESRYLGCNKMFLEAAGLGSPAEVVGKSDYDLPWSREQAEGYRDTDQAVILSKTPQMQFEEQQLVASGDTTTVLTSKVPLTDGDGKVIGVLGIYSDITERKQLELRLAQSSKLQSIGQLAAGIAHEINTPMQSVCGNVEFLRNCHERLFEIVHVCLKMLEPPDMQWAQRRAYVQDFVESKRFNYILEQVPQAMAEADESAKRVIEIVQAMKAMSHPGTITRVGVDINTLLHNAATISRNRWKYHAELVEEFDALPEIQAMPADLSQVFLNLFVNAADAIAEKFPKEHSIEGRITVRTRLLGKFVCIEVEDNGGGIPASIQHKIFDPFFTTKEVGKGTGQGLSIVYDVIVHRHQGSIDVSSHPGEGTKFIMLLPMHTKREVKSGAVAELLEEMRQLEECLA